MRTITDKNHRTIAFLETETHIETQVDAFLVDRRAQRKSEGTLGVYRQKLALFGESALLGYTRGAVSQKAVAPSLARN